MQREKGKRTALQWRHHPWARASGVPDRTRPSTTGGGSQGIKIILLNGERGGLAQEKIQKKLVFQNTLLSHRTYFNVFSSRHQTAPVCALRLPAVRECPGAPSSGARTDLLPRDTKLIPRGYKAAFGNV